MNFKEEVLNKLTAINGRLAVIEGALNLTLGDYGRRHELGERFVRVAATAQSGQCDPDKVALMILTLGEDVSKELKTRKAGEVISWHIDRAKTRIMNKRCNDR